MEIAYNSVSTGDEKVIYPRLKSGEYLCKIADVSDKPDWESYSILFQPIKNTESEDGKLINTDDKEYAVWGTNKETEEDFPLGVYLNLPYKSFPKKVSGEDPKIGPDTNLYKLLKGIYGVARTSEGKVCKKLEDLVGQTAIVEITEVLTKSGKNEGKPKNAIGNITKDPENKPDAPRDELQESMDAKDRKDAKAESSTSIDDLEA